MKLKKIPVLVLYGENEKRHRKNEKTIHINIEQCIHCYYYNIVPNFLDDIYSYYVLHNVYCVLLNKSKYLSLLISWIGSPDKKMSTRDNILLFIEDNVAIYLGLKWQGKLYAPF